MPAKCGSKKNNDVYFMVSEDNEREAENILEIIKYVQADDKMNLSDIGILSRSLKASTSCFNTLIELLEKNNINYNIRGADDLKDNDELKYVLTLMYHLIQEDDPYYTVVPGDVTTWLNLKTLTGANDNKVLFELSDDTKKILNDLQDKFEKEVIEMDKIVCRENGWGNGIKGFPGMFKGKKTNVKMKYSAVLKNQYFLMKT